MLSGPLKERVSCNFQKCSEDLHPPAIELMTLHPIQAIKFNTVGILRSLVSLMTCFDEKVDIQDDPSAEGEPREGNSSDTQRFTESRKVSRNLKSRISPNEHVLKKEEHTKVEKRLKKMMVKAASLKPMNQTDCPSVPSAKVDTDRLSVFWMSDLSNDAHLCNWRSSTE